MNDFLRKWALPALAVAGFAITLAWLAGLFDERIEPGLLPDTAAGKNTLLPVISQQYREIERVPGTLGAQQSTRISARILARIESVEVRAGDTVKKGDLLARLEQADALARLSQATEQVRSLEARYKEAELALQRARSLQERQLIAAADLDRARSDRDALKAQLAAARQAAAESEISLRYSEIRTPIDGRIVERLAEPGDTAIPGTPLLTIYNPATLRVEARVREKLAVELKTGQALSVEIPVIGREMAAEIDEIVPAADVGSRSFLVKARLEYDEMMRPGMYAELLVPGDMVERTLVPDSALAHVGQLDFVRVEQNGSLQRRVIKLGKPAPPAHHEVLSGLVPGERVAVYRD